MARLERSDTVEGLNWLLDQLDVMVLAADAANGFLELGDEKRSGLLDHAKSLLEPRL